MFFYPQLTIDVQKLTYLALSHDQRVVMLVARDNDHRADQFAHYMNSTGLAFVGLVELTNNFLISFDKQAFPGLVSKLWLVTYPGEITENPGS